MTRPLKYSVLLAALITTSFVAVCWLFDTLFANLSIDWLAFLTTWFLMIEAVYKMFKFRDPVLPNQLFRVFRILIGAQVFTIHLIQYTWGVNCAFLAAAWKQTALDWSALFFGVFLMVEGAWRILREKTATDFDQLLRITRVIIGASVFMIHLLQLMR